MTTRGYFDEPWANATGSVEFVGACVATPAGVYAGAWEDHNLVRSPAAGASVPGLILHAAGPTDDGFRTIDVWVSESAWSRYRQRLAHVFGGLLVPPVVRELRADHLITAALRPDTSVSPDPRTEPQDPDTCETGPWTWSG